MRKKWFLSVPLLFTVLPLLAHEFWLLPHQFSYSLGQKVYVRLQVGENFEGKNWTGTNAKANFLFAANNNYRFDLLPYLGNTPGDSVRLDTIIYPGNYTICYAGKNATIEMPAADFNAYLQEEGLTDALRHRQAYNQDTATGRESYQRCAKTLIRIKSRMSKSDYLKSSFYTSATGLPLDIIPIDNPYNLKGRGTLTFNVYFEGKMLNTGRLQLWQRIGGKTIQSEIAIENGIATAAIEPKGTWMVSMVKMIVDPVKGNGYWQSYWGSLTWGYDQ